MEERVRERGPPCREVTPDLACQRVCAPPRSAGGAREKPPVAVLKGALAGRTPSSVRREGAMEHRREGDEAGSLLLTRHPSPITLAASLHPCAFCVEPALMQIRRPSRAGCRV